MLTHLQHVKLISIVFIGRFLEHKEVVVHIPLEQIVLQGSLEDQLAWGSPNLEQVGVRDLFFALIDFSQKLVTDPDQDWAKLRLWIVEAGVIHLVQLVERDRETQFVDVLGCSVELGVLELILFFLHVDVGVILVAKAYLLRLIWIKIVVHFNLTTVSTYISSVLLRCDLIIWIWAGVDIWQELWARVLLLRTLTWVVLLIITVTPISC